MHAHGDASPPVADAGRHCLRGLLAGPRTHLVTLTGLRGVGKTTVARSLLSAPAPNVDWVDISGIDDPRQLSAVLADHVGPDHGRKTVPAPDRRIVVVDGLIESDTTRSVVADSIARWSTETPGLVVVLTTLAPLRVSGEQVVRIEPFAPVPPGLPDDQLAQHPAVATFCDVARPLREGLDDPVTLREVATVCNQLGGLPVAIHLAAARANLFDPATMSSMLTSSDGDGTWLGEADPFAAIDWTISLLTPAQRRLVEDLSVFAGAVPFDAVVAVTEVGDPIEQLSALVDAHLVDPLHRDGATTFRLHPVVRNRLRVRPGNAEERHRRRAAHIRWVRGIVDGLRPDGPFTVDPLVRTVEAEITRACRRALADGDLPLAATTVLAVVPLWFERGVAVDEYDVVIGLAERAAGADRPLEARLAAWAALLRADRVVKGESSVVGDEMSAALDLAGDVGGRVLLDVLVMAVRSSLFVGDPDLARQRCLDGRRLAEEMGDERAFAFLEVWSGMFAAQDGDETAALELGGRALDRARRVDDPALVVAAANLLRSLPLDQRRAAGVQVPAVADLLDDARRRDDARTVSLLLPSVALDAFEAGDFEQAAQALVEMLETVRAARAWLWAVAAMMILAAMAARRGELDRAARLQGMASSHWEVGRRAMLPSAVHGYEAAVGWLRHRLGAEEYDRRRRRCARRCPLLHDVDPGPGRRVGAPLVVEA